MDLLKTIMMRIILSLILLLFSISVPAQELVVKSFQENTMDLSASTRIRVDNNNEPCALVKVHMAIADAKFEPNVIGDVFFNTNEYWVYLPVGTKHVKIKHPNYLTQDVVFADFGIKSLQKKTTYELVVVVPLRESNGNREDDSYISVFVKGFPLKMMLVEGGESNSGSKLQDYYIGQTEVTERIWQAVMNDADVKDIGNKPMSRVNWKKCHEFIDKLNELTGLKFRLPIEEEWEYAAKGGKQTHQYKYSGSDNIDEVACYNKIYGPDEVASKKPNELGIFDMSGSVWEWCDNACDGTVLDENYSIVPENTEMPIRGGSWYSRPDRCGVKSRACQSADLEKDFIGFRLVLDKQKNAVADRNSEEDINVNVDTFKDSVVVTIADYRLTLLRVDGGTYTMGATSEQKNYAFVDEFPAHKVDIKDFYMCKEKIEIPHFLVEILNLKVDKKDEVDKKDTFNYEEAVSLQKFLIKKTGILFRIPTEEEWEYAARGGKKSKNYIYSGTDEDEINWDWETPMAPTANELGLISMSEGNKEWTSAYYTKYPTKDIVDFENLKKECNIVVRGGGSGRRKRNSARIQSTANKKNALRLILTLN